MTNGHIMHMSPPPRLHGASDSGNEHLDDLLREAERPHQHIDSPHTALHYPAPEQRLPPVVLVEGFFSFFNEYFWGPIEMHLNASRSSKGLPGDRRIIFARCGPVSSMHDRACELYYTLKGGTVDYGEEHSKQCGHARYGRNFETGSYPSWSVAHPVHFVAHSLGGTTITVLQTLIAQGHFGPDAHPDMIASISTVGAPFRGTAFPYLLGKSYQNSVDTRFFSVDSLITKSVHVLSWFKPFIPSRAPLPDWLADARQLTMREMSVFKLMGQLWRSDWGEGRDVISHDATFEGSRVIDEAYTSSTHGGKPGPRTFYRSYVCCMTRREGQYSPYHVPSYKSPVLESVFLYSFAGLVGKFDFRTVRPLPPFYKPGKPPRPTLAPHLVVANEWARVGAGSNSGFEVGDDTLRSGKGNGNVPPLDSTFRAPRGPTGARIDLGEDYYANDGVVPLFSQWHPGPCSPTHCLHHSTLSQPHPSTFFFGLPSISSSSSTSSDSTSKSKLKSKAMMRPGIWNVCHIPDSTHVSLMPLWHGSQRQKEFWVEIGEWLERVDEAIEGDAERGLPVLESLDSDIDA